MFFEFNVEIQDGRQNWWENDFWERLPDDYNETAGIKTFVKTAVSRTVSQINAFGFYTEIQDGRQKWRENNFWEKSPDDSAGSKIMPKSLHIAPFLR